MPKEMFANHKLKDRVAEKFQTLIIKVIALCFVPQAGMRERFGQQKRIPEFVANTFLERTHLFFILSEVEESLNRITAKLCPSRRLPVVDTTNIQIVGRGRCAIASDRPRAR